MPLTDRLTNVHASICSFLDWRQKLMIYPQICPPWCKNKMAAVTHLQRDRGYNFIQNLLFNTPLANPTIRPAYEYISQVILALINLFPPVNATLKTLTYS